MLRMNMILNYNQSIGFGNKTYTYNQGLKYSNMKLNLNQPMVSRIANIKPGCSSCGK